MRVDIYFNSSNPVEIRIWVWFRNSNFIILVEIWKISKLDFVPLFITFVGCLIDTADGILIGIGVHLVILLFHYAMPDITDKQENNVLKIQIRTNLYFPRKFIFKSTKFRNFLNFFSIFWKYLKTKLKVPKKFRISWFYIREFIRQKNTRLTLKNVSKSTLLQEPDLTTWSCDRHVIMWPSRDSWDWQDHVTARFVLK